MEYNNRDYLYLIWKDPESRRNYVVGEISKNENYQFKYGIEIDEALEKGFELLIPFENKNKVYSNDILFPSFTSRLPDKKRRDIKKILNKYGLEEYDEYLFLKKSGARLPIDTLEFIDPLDIDMLKDEEEIEREFFIAGTRHYLECDGKCCENSKNLNISERLNLLHEPDNEYDNNAFQMLNQNEEVIGYLPRYYSKGMMDFLNSGFNYRCEVLEVNKDRLCSECIKVNLKIKKV